MAQMAGRVLCRVSAQGTRGQTERSSQRRSLRDQDVPKWTGHFRLKVGPSPYLAHRPTDALFYSLGIDGLVMFKRDTQFDAEIYTITVPRKGGQTSPFLALTRLLWISRLRRIKLCSEDG
jgi:hypothetical protein